MDNLPNGFTGFADKRPEGFESAGEASRRSRGMGPRASQAGAEAAAIAGVAAHAATGPGVLAQCGHRASPDISSSAPANEIPFDRSELELISERESRWSWLEIDLSAIRYNVAQSRRLLQPRCRLMAVVKADGYGHGAIEVSKAALGAGADRLAVSNVAEAIELRKAGITAPILILSQPPETSIPLLLGYKVTPSVFAPDFAIHYAETADLHGMRAPYHLAVNTGMNRIGVRFDEALDFLHQVSFHRALELEGTFTHFATADCPETLDFQIQAKRFVDVVSDMQASGFDPGIVHAANSAAAFRYPGVHFDMARLGIALYGLHPCYDTRSLVELRPAMSVHARITDTRMLGVSEGVSYGLRYRSPGSVKICTIPLGYADGLRRGLSGNTDFIMGGRYYRQVGDICMDQCMFEVDMRHSAARAAVDPRVGDEVVIVGSQGIAQVTMEEMAEKLGTISYEVAIGFSHRLPKVYV